MTCFSEPSALHQVTKKTTHTSSSWLSRQNTNIITSIGEEGSGEMPGPTPGTTSPLSMPNELHEEINRHLPKQPISSVRHCINLDGDLTPSALTVTARKTGCQNFSSWVDIHRNPPSQSRDPMYTINPHPPSAPSVEIRADDIRKATRVPLRHRSPKLPTPTAISDGLMRPIVCFESERRGREFGTRTANCEPCSGESGADDRGPGKLQGDDLNLSETPLPPPQFHIISDEGVYQSETDGIGVDSSICNGFPAIKKTTSDVQSKSRLIPASEALPAFQPIPMFSSLGNGNLRYMTQNRVSDTLRARAQAASDSERPNPRHGPNHRFRSATHRNDATLCHQCDSPILGRFIALSGSPEHFHPHCFNCVICGTSLEALEIYHEPESHRQERLHRIRQRLSGVVRNEEPGKTMAEVGDDRLRFYCHLDWHELFAPRCKHCKTPIIGEHIVALGSHWHHGHFFCAECGDPFENEMTHIEKDGYAWCVKCHMKITERRAPKCQKCEEPVTGKYVMAMGGEWHENCFRCALCDGLFHDGQIFPRETATGDKIVLCTGCRAQELKQ